MKKHRFSGIGRRSWIAVSLAAGLGGALVLPSAALAKADYAWVQLMQGSPPDAGEEIQPRASVRAIVPRKDPCPTLYTKEGKKMAVMTERKQNKELKGFDAIKVCEASFDASDAHVKKFRQAYFDADHKVKAVTMPDLSNGVPMGDLVTYGCTGCREDKSQACSESKGTWHFGKMNQYAAGKTKDGIPPLVVHLGDYRYSGQKFKKADSWTWNDRYMGWKEEVFDPIEPLLNHGTWVFLRGNHEGCFIKGNKWISSIEKWRNRGSAWLYFFGEGDTTCEDLLKSNTPDVLPPFALDASVYTKTGKASGQKVRMVFMDTVRTGDGVKRDKQTPLTKELYTKIMERVDRDFVQAASDGRPIWLLAHIPAFSMKNDKLTSSVMFDALEGSSLKESLPRISLMMSAHVHSFSLVNGGYGNPAATGPFQFVVGNGGVALSGKPADQLGCRQGVPVDDIERQPVKGQDWAGVFDANFGFLHAEFNASAGGPAQAVYKTPFFDYASGAHKKHLGVNCQSVEGNFNQVVCKDFTTAPGTPACP